MSILNQVLSGQVAHLIFTLFLGFFLGLKEKKNPARDIKNYRDYKIEIEALVLLFIVAAFMGVLITNIQMLAELKPIQEKIASIPWYFLVPLVSFLADFGNYWAHRSLHSKHLWRFHRWHHSPSELFWFSGFRGSIVHILFMGLTSFILLILSGPNPWVLGTIAIQGLSAQMLGHINFNIKNKFLENVMVLPQYHRIHHGVERKYNDSNFSFVWTIWDKIFGTQNKPSDVPTHFEIGIMNSEKKNTFKYMLGLD